MMRSPSAASPKRSGPSSPRKNPSRADSQRAPSRSAPASRPAPCSTPARTRPSAPSPSCKRGSTSTPTSSAPTVESMPSVTGGGNRRDRIANQHLNPQVTQRQRDLAAHARFAYMVKKSQRKQAGVLSSALSSAPSATPAAGKISVPGSPRSQNSPPSISSSAASKLPATLVTKQYPRKLTPPPLAATRPHSCLTPTLLPAGARRNYLAETICRRWLEWQPVLSLHLTDLVRSGTIPLTEVSSWQRTRQEWHWNHLAMMLTGGIKLAAVRACMLDDPREDCSTLLHRLHDYRASAGQSQQKNGSKLGTGGTPAGGATGPGNVLGFPRKSGS